ncbi:hypothetical protein OE88DRAFT_1644580 [Heliocybe sulcata]|uniref:Uncharacterized protein n=1 Tax=Heliocybe sulcata TaxID=5364 RepID=A0A5C3N3P5_9AGAM|nr:hypothetical protein OE88DRAFT_1644580 [Heliocybe sulcata]
MARSHTTKSVIGRGTASKSKKPETKRSSNSCPPAKRKASPNASCKSNQRDEVWCPGCGKKYSQRWSWHRHIIDTTVLDTICPLVHEYQDSGSEAHLPEPLYREATEADMAAMRAYFPACRDLEDACPLGRRRQEERAEAQARKIRRGPRPTYGQAVEGSRSRSSSAESVEESVGPRRSDRARKSRFVSVIDVDDDMLSSSSSISEDDSDDGSAAPSTPVEDEPWRGWGDEPTWLEVDGAEEVQITSPSYREPDFVPDGVVLGYGGPCRTQYCIGLYGQLLKLESGEDTWMGVPWYLSM